MKNISFKQIQLKVDDSIVKNRSIFISEKNLDFENLILKEKDYATKIVNRVSTNLLNDLEKFIPYKDKVKFFIFDDIAKKHFEKFNFDHFLIKQSNLINRFSLKEISKNYNIDKLNIIVANDRLTIFSKKGNLFHTFENEVLQNLFIRLNLKNFNKIDDVYIKKVFNIKENLNGEYKISKTEEGIEIKNVEQNNFEIYQIILTLLAKGKTVIEITSMLFDSDEKGTVYKKSLVIKSTFEKIKSFYSDDSKLKALYLNLEKIDHINEEIILSNSKSEIKIKRVINEEDKFIMEYYLKCNASEKKSKCDTIEVNFRNLSSIKYKPKIDIKKVIYSMFMLFIFIFLIYLTFSTIFTPIQLSESFEILRNSFDDIWFYILIFTTLISVNRVFIISWILSPNKKDWKKVLLLTLRLSIAAAISSIVSIVTGLDYLGLVFWVWYMTKTMDVTTPRIIGAIGVSKLFTALVSLVAGLPFMILGTIYLSEYINSGLFSHGQLILPISWAGYFWINISSSLLFFVIFFKPLNKYFFTIRYRKVATWTNNGLLFLSDNNFQINTIRNSIKSFSLKSNQGKRIVLTIFIMYFVLCFQSWSIINLILQYNIGEYMQHDYFNFLKILSLKTIVVNFNHSIPIPGDVASSEWVIKLTFTGFFNDIYMQIPQISDNVDNLIAISSAETSILSRFWSFYLPQIYKFIFAITGMIILWEVSKRSKRK